MARYEAHLQCPGLELATFQHQLIGIAEAVGAELNWLDKRNATIALLLQPQGISVRLLVEFCGHSDIITCLLSSREGMARGAPQSKACFERVLTPAMGPSVSAEWLRRSGLFVRATHAAGAETAVRIDVIDDNASGANETFQQLKVNVAIESLAPQHPRHFCQHHIG